MYIVNLLTRLLVEAYRREARRISREADKLGKAQAAEALASVELAKQADAARQQSVELGIQKGHTVDRAIGVAAKANKIESLFKLDE